MLFRSKVDLPDNLGKRFVMKPETKPESMPVFRRFRSRQYIELPRAWAIPAAPESLRIELVRHGVQCEVLAEPRTVDAATFAITAKKKPKRPFQGHQELVLAGAWGPPSAKQLPAGTLWVDARQPLGMVAAQLLEAQSEDSLSTWNFLEAATGDTYPVLRVLGKIGRAHV